METDMKTTLHTVLVTLVVCALGAAQGCEDADGESSSIVERREASAGATSAAIDSLVASSNTLYDGTAIDAAAFFEPHQGGNARACSTCHRPEDGFALTPATVERRYRLLMARRRYDPAADDPLFRSRDADDLERDFTTLRTKALVRVDFTLPPNIKLARDPSATRVALFRAVPTVRNTAFTAPFQASGELSSLESQAQAALLTHSELPGVTDPALLASLSAFQAHLFSSKRARAIADALRAGTALSAATRQLGPLERQGKQTFEAFCVSCHGGPTQTVNTDARFLPPPQRGPLPGAQQFVNVFVQTPRPPAPPFAGLPSAGLPEETYLVTLTDGSVQTVVSSDPGRMLITGDIRENGRFDVPTLFGIAQTAPYFHDNSAATLEQVIDHYQAVFKFMQAAELSGLFAPASQGQGCGPGECGFAPIPDAEIEGLLAYLRQL
jgi:cytochrome c peroxidase